MPTKVTDKMLPTTMIRSCKQCSSVKFYGLMG
jgi:hypothetical protein